FQKDLLGYKTIIRGALSLIDAASGVEILFERLLQDVRTAERLHRLGQGLASDRPIFDPIGIWHIGFPTRRNPRQGAFRQNAQRKWRRESGQFGSPTSANRIGFRKTIDRYGRCFLRLKTVHFFSRFFGSGQELWRDVRPGKAGKRSAAVA